MTTLKKLRVPKDEILLFSRSGFCENCKRNGSPKTGERFLVWHTTHKKFLIHHVQRHSWSGFTPHIFATALPLPRKGNVVVEVNCGICGVSISEEENENGRFNIQILEPRVDILRHEDFIALWKKFKNTGYEI